MKLNTSRSSMYVSFLYSFWTSVLSELKIHSEFYYNLILWFWTNKCMINITIHQSVNGKITVSRSNKIIKFIILLQSFTYLLSVIVSSLSFTCISFLWQNYFGKNSVFILSFKKLTLFLIFANIANKLTITYPDIFLTISSWIFLLLLH